MMVPNNKSRIFVLMLVVAMLLAGCATLRSRRAPEQVGFLGDYSKLEKSQDSEALVYVSDDVVWSNYNSIQIDSVTLWATEETSKLSQKDKQMLTDTLYLALTEELGEVFAVTQTGGANTLRLRAALTQAKGANVPLRTVTTAVPQLRLAGNLMGLAVDTAMTVGVATIEAEVRDSVTGAQLAAVVDERVGGKALLSKASYTTWGDVQKAARFWAQRIAWRLARAGVVRKPGAAMPEKPEPGRSI